MLDWIPLLNQCKSQNKMCVKNYVEYWNLDAKISHKKNGVANKSYDSTRCLLISTKLQFVTWIIYTLSIFKMKKKKIHHNYRNRTGKASYSFHAQSWRWNEKLHIGDLEFAKQRKFSKGHGMFTVNILSADSMNYFPQSKLSPPQRTFWTDKYIRTMNQLRTLALSHEMYQAAIRHCPIH